MQLEENINKRRTFAIIAHPDAGKTTLTEKLLLYGGAIQLAGAVKARGNQRRATSDWMKVERERGISVSSSVMTFNYKEKIYCESIWKVVDEKNNYVGQITSGAFSPDFNKIVALGMINKDCASNKNRLFTLINGKKYLTHIHEKPFI